MELKVEDARKHYQKYLKIHEKRFAKIIEHVTSGDVDKKSKSILDVGCHSLILLSTLRDMGYRNVHGIDVPLFIEAFDLDTINRFNLKNCDLQNDAIPFEDNKFDIIIMSEVIEHLFFNPTDCLMDLKRTLKPGGKLIITTPNIYRSANLIKMLSCKNIFSLPSVGPSGHFKEYSIEDINDFVETCDLKRDHVSLANLFRNPKFLYQLIVSAISFIDPRRRDSIVGIYSKKPM